jgi:hypothetical protein
VSGLEKVPICVGYEVERVRHNQNNEIAVRLNRRTYSPVLRQPDLHTVNIPWWGGRQLRYEYQ